MTVQSYSNFLHSVQRRFEVTANLPATHFLYEVPLTWTRANNVNFNDLKPVQVLAQESTTISRGSTGFEWVIFNKQQTGKIISFQSIL